MTVATEIVFIVTRDGHGAEFKRNEFFIKYTDYGITLTPKDGHECGWKSKTYPWANIGTVEERSA